MDEELIKNPAEEQTQPAGTVSTTETATESMQPQGTGEVKTILEKYVPGTDGGEQDVLKALQMLDNLHEKFMVAVENDPEFGAALSDILAGEEARVALARAYGPDAFSAVEGDPDYDKMSTAFASAKERLAKKSETANMIKKNQEMSVKEITSWMEEKGYDDAGIQARLQKMEEIRQDFLNDKITRNHLELIDKAMDFDTAVQQAEESGKVAGRNEQIVEKRVKAKTSGDGLPNLMGQDKKPEQPKSFASKFMDDVI